MPSEERSPRNPTEGGGVSGSTEPPKVPPTASTGSGSALTVALLAAAGVATLTAFVTFLLGCQEEVNQVLIDVGILTAILAMILDTLASYTLGGGAQGKTEAPKVPPAVANAITAADIVTALGLLAVLLGCVSERHHGTALAGYVALLLAMVLNFLALYQVSSGSAARG